MPMSVGKTPAYLPARREWRVEFESMQPYVADKFAGIFYLHGKQAVAAYFKFSHDAGHKPIGLLGCQAFGKIAHHMRIAVDKREFRFVRLFPVAQQQPLCLYVNSFLHPAKLIKKWI